MKVAISRAPCLMRFLLFSIWVRHKTPIFYQDPSCSTRAGNNSDPDFGNNSPPTLLQAYWGVGKGGGDGDFFKIKYEKLEKHCLVDILSSWCYFVQIQPYRRNSTRRWPTDGRTDRQTDTLSYRDRRTHLKNGCGFCPKNLFHSNLYIVNEKSLTKSNSCQPLLSLLTELLQIWCFREIRPIPKLDTFFHS